MLLKPIDPIINPSGRSEFWTACVGKGAEAGLEVWQSWLLGASSAVASKKGDEKDKDKVASKRTKELEGTLVGVLKVSHAVHSVSASLYRRKFALDSMSYNDRRAGTRQLGAEC